MRNRGNCQQSRKITGHRTTTVPRRRAQWGWPALILPALMAALNQVCAGQTVSGLPDEPKPASQSSKVEASMPCQVEAAGAAVGSVAVARALAGAGYSIPPAAVQRGTPCPALPRINWYMRFTNGPQVKPLTPGEKGWLALRNLVDPFNVITVLGDSGIAVASDSHSAYGPGFRGFARNAGVSFTQDATGEFFGTFLIPSIARQDPHYHRMPHASIPHRAAHAAFQVLWTQGDNGKGMPNYANIVGFAIDDEIGNLYVPGQRTNVPSSAARYGIGLATAPIDNFVTEFVPDIASHIHVQIVVIQRIINQVARTTSNGDTP